MSIEGVNELMVDAQRIQHRFLLNVRDICKADIGFAMSTFNISRESAVKFASISTDSAMLFAEIKTPLLQIMNGSRKDGLLNVLDAISSGNIERINLTSAGMRI
jgi:hypothetical protein